MGYIGSFMKAIWDISNKCNLSCKYCGSGFKDEHGKTEMSLEDIESIISNIKSVIKEVDLYGGEPFCLKNIKAILEKLSLNEIDINITTNGQCDTSILNFISKENIRLKNIAVSIDGNESETDILRGKGVYKKAIRFLKEAILEKNSSRKQWEIGISAVITQINKGGICESIDEWIGLGVDYVIILPVVERGHAKDNRWLLLNEEELLNLYERLTQHIISKNLKDKVFIEISIPLLAEYLNAKYGAKYMIESSGCHAVENAVYINAMGMLKSCRDNSEYVADLKEKKLAVCYNGFNDFMCQKEECVVEMECDCIYNKMCNKCCLSKQNKKEKICGIIEKNYLIEKLAATRLFWLANGACLFNNVKQDYYNIFYSELEEKTAYEPVGYQILNAIYGSKMTCLDIAEILNVDYKLVFRFLIQEYTKNHVLMEEKAGC